MSHCSYNFKKRNTSITERLKNSLAHTKIRLSPFSNNHGEVDLRELPRGVLIEQ